MPASTGHDPHLRELGAFLRTRRSELEPSDLGITRAATRSRVPGLRREEVAERARISSDYYARIEQGRLAPSPEVLADLVEALRLSVDQADYLGVLADHAGAPSHVLSRGPSTGDHRSPLVRPQMSRLIDQLTDTPALVLGPRMDVLAWNSLASRVYVDFSTVPAPERNYVKLVFTDDRMRSLFDDWESVARACVAILRREAAANPSDPELTSLVGELTVADPKFAEWWASHDVARQDFGTKLLHHPLVGDLTLDWDIFRHAASPEQQLVLNSVEPGSVTQERLGLLVPSSTQEKSS